MNVYGNVLQKALKASLRVLMTVAHTRVSGISRTVIKVNTLNDLVVIPDWMREAYPTTMILIVEGTSSEFHASDQGYMATYLFGGVAQELFIPYEAIMEFHNEAEQLSLFFEGGPVEQKEFVEEQPLLDEVPKDAAPPENKVVSLAAWKKAKGKPLTKFEEAGA